ncbi:6910_t:CDS:2, partial [Gigaspora rosea]
MATSDPSSSDLNGSKVDVASSSSIHSIQNLIADQFKAKDEKIEKLQKELDYYKKQYESLQNNMSPDQPINNRNYDPKKVTELKVAINKVVDDVLLTNKLIDVGEDGSNNTNNSSINHATPHMNNMNIIDQVNVDSSFVNPQNRPSDDNELINEVTKTSNHNFPPSIPDGKPPTTYIIHPHSSHPPHPPHTSHPPTRRFNNPGKSDKLNSNSNYTVFIAWTGSMTQEGLKALFDNDE